LVVSKLIAYNSNNVNDSMSSMTMMMITTMMMSQRFG